MSHCYWNLLLALESQKCSSIITSDGIFTPTRVLHRITNAVTHLQSSLDAVIPDELRPNILLRLNDILLYGPSEKKLLTFVQLIIGLCVKNNIKIPPEKCVIFTFEVC